MEKSLEKGIKIWTFFGFFQIFLYHFEQKNFNQIFVCHRSSKFELKKQASLFTISTCMYISKQEVCMEEANKINHCKIIDKFVD
jgi:hypothetical protein